MATNICMLNRKPYWGADGIYRQRWKCCGAKNNGKTCQLQKQPEGEIINDRLDKPIRRTAKRKRSAA